MPHHYQRMTIHLLHPLHHQLHHILKGSKGSIRNKANLLAAGGHLQLVEISMLQIGPESFDRRPIITSWAGEYDIQPQFPQVLTDLVANVVPSSIHQSSAAAIVQRVLLLKSFYQ